MRTSLPSGILLAALAGCSSPAAVTPTAPVDGDVLPPAAVETPAERSCAPANLEIIPLDIWGRDLDSATVLLDRDLDGMDDPEAAPAVRSVRLGAVPLELGVRIDAPDHLAASLTVVYDGTGVSGLSVQGPGDGSGLVQGDEVRGSAEAWCEVHTLYVGLDHAWFAASGRSPKLNDITLIMDGQTYWADVFAEVSEATERVTWASWAWSSDFELVRHEWWTPWATRTGNTVWGLLESIPEVEKRLLVSRYWADNSDLSIYANTDTELRDAGETAGDGIEVILQGNPTAVPLFDQYEPPEVVVDFGARVASHPIYGERDLEQGTQLRPPPLTVDAASYHQKTIVVDGEVAWVSGMNTDNGNWDRSEHLVFDAPRSDFIADRADWDAIDAGEMYPEVASSDAGDGLFKDYAVRIEGPMVREVESVLRDRWDLGITNGAMYADNASSFTLDPPAAEVPDGVMAQLTLTMPEPYTERSILESQLKAIRNAESLIVVEDQYFRTTIVNQALVDRMHERPDLRLVVLTRPIGGSEFGAHHTWISHATFAQLFGDRYLLLQLFASDVTVDEGWFWDDVIPHFRSIYLHSKLRMVDDRYLSVGSANMNNRGYLYEGEMNVTVFDEDFVRPQRMRIFENLLGTAASRLTGDPAEDFALLREVAGTNESIRDWWDAHADDLSADEGLSTWRDFQPTGFVFPLHPEQDYLFEAGPDAF